MLQYNYSIINFTQRLTLAHQSKCGSQMFDPPIYKDYDFPFFLLDKYNKHMVF